MIELIFRHHTGIIASYHLLYDTETHRTMKIADLSFTGVATRKDGIIFIIGMAVSNFLYSATYGTYESGMAYGVNRGSMEAHKPLVQGFQTVV